MDRINQEKVNEALSTKTKSSRELKLFSGKNEPVPNFIKGNAELLELYNRTDLELKDVYKKCMELIPLKNITVSNESVQSWFVEFIKLGWTTYNFNRQYEAVKRAKIFGGLDFNIWVTEERMYGESEFNLMLTNKIEEMIRLAAVLNPKDIKLSNKEIALQKLIAYKQLKLDCIRRRSDLMEDEKRLQLKQIREKLSEKKKLISELSDKKKKILLDDLIDEGIFYMSEKKKEYKAILKHLDAYADLIPLNLITN